MTSIILTSDQLQQWRVAAGNVELLDESGNLLGYVAKPVSAEVLTTALQRSTSDGPWHTTADVLNHLNSLGNG